MKAINALRQVIMEKEQELAELREALHLLERDDCNPYISSEYYNIDNIIYNNDQPIKLNSKHWF